MWMYACGCMRVDVCRATAAARDAQQHPKGPMEFVTDPPGPPLVLQCVAVCCSVLQCVAVCCSVLQCVAVCCSVLQCP